MEEKKTFITNVLYYGLIFGLVYLFCNYLFGIFAPFILGFIFAYIAVRLTKKLFKKETKVLRVVSLIVLYVIIIALFALLAVLGVNELIEFIDTIPSLYKQYVEPVLLEMSSKNTKNIILFGSSIDVTELFNTLSDSIKTLLSNISGAIVSSGTSLISNTTSIIIAILTTLITSFFVAYDYEDILNYLERLFDGATKGLYTEIKDYLVNTVFLVVRSYLIIMSITFIELLIGLMIIGIDNFALVSMIVAFLDILPILGVGTVLIPWALFKFVIGDIGIGIGLLIVYIIITIVRNIIEPKLVGGNLGLHPLATLFTMLVGLELFGGLGMFGGPLIVSFLVKRELQLDENNNNK